MYETIGKLVGSTLPPTCCDLLGKQVGPIATTTSAEAIRWQLLLCAGTNVCVWIYIYVCVIVQLPIRKHMSEYRRSLSVCVLTFSCTCI